MLKVNLRRSALFIFVLGVGMFTPVRPAVAADHGQPLWLDLVTEDSNAAASFYHGLFGWEIGPDRGGNRRISFQGTDIAGLFQISNEMPNAAESQWLVGIAVDDLERAVRSTKEAGGAILRNITVVPDSGRYAVIRDPQGAVLMLGTPSREIGGPREPGFFVWAELWTRDLEAAADFYASVLGATRKDLERPGGTYTVFETGDEPRAGLVLLPENAERPAWAPYIGVVDLADTLRRTVSLGGNVVLEPRDDFGGGRVALIEDPTHAMLFIVQLTTDQEPSR